VRSYWRTILGRGTIPSPEQPTAFAVLAAIQNCTLATSDSEFQAKGLTSRGFPSVVEESITNW